MNIWWNSNQQCINRKKIGKTTTANNNTTACIQNTEGKGTNQEKKNDFHQLHAFFLLREIASFFWSFFAIAKSKRIVGKVFFCCCKTLQMDDWECFVLFFVCLFCFLCTLYTMYTMTVRYLPLFWSFFVSSVIFVWLNTCKCRRCERDSFGCDN